MTEFSARRQQLQEATGIKNHIQNEGANTGGSNVARKVDSTSIGASNIVNDSLTSDIRVAQNV
jgi:hypothetical protein